MRHVICVTVLLCGALGCDNSSSPNTQKNSKDNAQPTSKSNEPRVSLFIGGVSLETIISTLPNGLKIVDHSSSKDHTSNIENNLLSDYLTKTYQGKPLVIKGIEANGNSQIKVSESIYGGVYDVRLDLMDITKLSTALTTILYKGKQVDVDLLSKSDFRLNKQFSPKEAINIRDFSKSFLVQIHLFVDSFTLRYDGTILISVKDFEKIYMNDSDCKRIGITYPYTLKK